MDYEADKAGSRSKNRFKFEVYWGLNKFLDAFRKSQNFTMVFDYVCDIELHYDEFYEFYQVKTSTSKIYNTSMLTAKGKKKNSIIGTLYKIRSKETEKGAEKSKLAIVSNLYFQDPLAPENPNVELAFSNIKNDNKSKILEALKNEFPENEIDIENIFFIKTDLEISNFKETMIGKINTFYQDIYGEDVMRPAALLRILAEEVQLKADYEGELVSHDAVLEKKGLSIKRFEVILDKYSEHMFSMVEKCRDEIKKVERNAVKRLTYFKALPEIISGIRKHFYLNELEMEVSKDILSKLQNFEDGETFDIAKQYIKVTNIDFPIEYSISERELFALVALLRLEDQQCE